MNGQSASLDLQTELVAASRERVVSRMSQRERLTHLISAFAFLFTATALALHGSSSTRASPVLLAAFVAAVAVASHVELEVGSGAATPAELVVIPMLFALPSGLVPAVVALGLVCAQLPSYVRHRVPAERVVVAIGNASYTLAPALLFVLFYEPDAGGAHLALLTLAAVGSQFFGDAAISTAREYFAVGVDPRALAKPLLWVFSVDACLAPVGYIAALAGSLWAPAYLLPLPLLLLIRLFAQERAERLTNALELSAAYRGTALLLGDVLEADDAYTGAHSREVVELALAVADELRLDTRSRHLVELTALLHDVGKIKVPTTIINKQGPLTAEERTRIETHTIEGQHLLSRVGGLLTEVGQIVRSCHERYDGHGYPDGLSGIDIPLVARIVCCCDAYNAMTTTRSYRAAMPPVTARAELLRNRGSQFDPDVVDAVLRSTEV